VNSINTAITSAGFHGVFVTPWLRAAKGAVRPAKGLSTVNLC